MALGSGLFAAGEFAKRGVIKLAPDCLVYIGGSLNEQIIAPVSGKSSNISFNDGISSVNVSNSLDPGASTATIEVLAPVYNETSNYWVTYKTSDGIQRHPVFVPMAEVKIYMKGRFLVKNAPQYYPVFWGFITTVEENYSGGIHKITLQCADILHWWGLTTITTHPTPESKISAGMGPTTGQTLTPYATIFQQGNPFVILRKLFTDMGMDQFVSPAWVAQLGPQHSAYPKGQLGIQATGIMSYWDQRFKNLGSLLKMYGITGNRYDVVDVPGLKGKAAFQVKKIPASGETETVATSQDQAAAAERPMEKYDFDEKFLLHFTPFFDYTKMGTFQEAETMTKLDIAMALKSRVDFEFFQDTNGEFIFKPPFYNLNMKGVQPYEIEPYDVISCSFAENSDAIITAIQAYGSFTQQFKDTPKPRRPAFYMDTDLASRYGVRYKSVNMEYVADSSIMQSLAIAQMNLMNAQAWSGSVTMPLRPELRLGYPIYLRHRDSHHYVRTINHTFDFGGGATTALGLFTERRRVFKVSDSGKRTNEIQRYYAYKYKEPAAPVEQKDKKKPVKVSDQDNSAQLVEKFQQGDNPLKTGFYELVQDPTVIGVDPTSIPYTDADGYRVVGGFPYGRGLQAYLIDNDQIALSKSTVTNQITDMAASYAESARMDGLFFPDKEGAVPGYLNGDRIDSDENSSEVPPVQTAAQATATGPNDVPTSKGIPSTVSTSSATQKVTLMAPDVGSSDTVSTATAQLASWAAADAQSAQASTQSAGGV